MKTYKLEKPIRLYKSQFDRFLLDLFDSYALDRASMDLDAIVFRMEYMKRHHKDLDQLPDLEEQFMQQSETVRKTFGTFLFHMVAWMADPKYPAEFIKDILTEDLKIDPSYVTFTMVLLSDSKEFLEYIDQQYPDAPECVNLFPGEFFRFTSDSYNDGIAKAYPELFHNRQQNQVGVGNDADVFCHSFTFQTTERCSLNCTYCYQVNKTPMRMDFEMAKTFIDHLLHDEYGYINRYNSPAIIIEFIGGEPLMEIRLTRKIYEYFLEQCYELNHPWFHLHRLSICSNGMQYFDKEVQSFFQDYHRNISFNISIDGNKELHDACRIQPNGEGSYDIDIAALEHYSRNYTSERNSKMTLAPSNIKYLYDSVVNFINRGMQIINLNCVFEEGWNQKTARIEYDQLKRLADYIVENNLEHLYIAIFRERPEDTQPHEQDGNFCFHENTMVTTPNGAIRIADLKPGDLVLSASGTPEIVEKMNQYHSDRNIRFRATGTFPIQCTSDHKFFARKLKYRYRADHYRYYEPDFLTAEELEPYDQIALPILPLQNRRRKTFSADIAWLLGIYGGDGWIDPELKHVIIAPNRSRFYEVERVLKKVEMQYFVERMRRYKRFIIPGYGCSINRHFYKYCMESGSDMYEKRACAFLFDSPADIVESYLDGLVDADGYRQLNGRRKLSTTSKTLATDVLVLLRMIGQTPTCHLNDKDTKRELFELYWNPVLVNGGYMFNFDDTYPVLWTRIRSKEEVDGFDVYCPSLVSENPMIGHEHTFIADGVAAKNCGGLGSMLAMRPNGQFYPCIRYMPSSITDGKEDMCIGDVEHGIIGREQGSPVLKMMDSITRRTQSNDVCYDCPINNSCAWCSALSYEVYGTPNKRPMFICIQMIAEALANVYYWNRLLLKHPEYHLTVRKNNVPDEWALLVIDQSELDELKLLETAAIQATIERQLKEHEN